MAKIRRIGISIDGSEEFPNASLSEVYSGLTNGSHTLTARAYNELDEMVSQSIRNFEKMEIIEMPRPENLIRFYKFNETTGDAIDETGTQDGTVFGGMTRDGSAYTGNGTNAYVNAGLTSETTEYTIYTRITTPVNVSDTKMLFSKYESAGDKSVYIFINGGELNVFCNRESFTHPISAESTYEFTITSKSGGVLALFENGVNVQSIPMVGFSGTNSDLFLFQRDSDLYSDVTMDCFALWDVELNQTEINNIPNGSL